jgi:hypothetical protein
MALRSDAAVGAARAEHGVPVLQLRLNVRVLTAVAIAGLLLQRAIWQLATRPERRGCSDRRLTP